MIDFLSKVKLKDLPEEQLEIAEIVGLEKYIALVRHFGGNCIRILQPRTLTNSYRNQQIIEDFDGKNARALSIKYGLSYRLIRMIIRNGCKNK